MIPVQSFGTSLSWGWLALVVASVILVIVGLARWTLPDVDVELVPADTDPVRLAQVRPSYRENAALVPALSLPPPALPVERPLAWPRFASASMALPGYQVFLDPAEVVLDSAATTAVDSELTGRARVEFLASCRRALTAPPVPVSSPVMALFGLDVDRTPGVPEMDGVCD